MARRFLQLTPAMNTVPRPVNELVRVVQFKGFQTMRTNIYCPKVHTLFFTGCSTDMVNNTLFPVTQFPELERVFTEADESHDIELAGARFRELKDLPPHNRGFTVKELEEIVGAGNIRRFMKFMTGQTYSSDERGDYYYPGDVLTFIRLQTRQRLYRYFKDDGVPIR